MNHSGPRCFFLANPSAFFVFSALSQEILPFFLLWPPGQQQLSKRPLDPPRLAKQGQGGAWSFSIHAQSTGGLLLWVFKSCALLVFGHFFRFALNDDKIDRAIAIKILS